MERIKERKLRTMTAKSRSVMFLNKDTNQDMNNRDRIDLMQRKRDE